MKRILAIATCSLPFLLTPLAYAQTQPAAPAADGSTSTGGGTTAPGSTPAPSSPSGATPAAPMSDTAPAAAGAPDAANATQAISGWSVKEKILDKDVYNEKDEKVGKITDVILETDGKAVYYVIGAGGFLGMGAHDVAIPFDKVTQGEDRLTLQGYTKDQLKALPKVEVAK